MKRGAAIALLAAVLLAATFFAGFRAGRRDTAADVVVRVDTVVLERPAPDAVRYERTVVLSYSLHAPYNNSFFLS